ncbi:hypothetical protein RIVM261_041420 [Rivularia sp. IAM M-261]|nr:hypothetical protein RIVM261_041420 [Rivularia sp. IAM M-261]
MPRVVWLETEDFEKACLSSETNLDKTTKINQWQMYLNTLAIIGFQRYLKERNPEIKINQDNKNRAFDNISYLTIDGFSICLIILDSVNELVTIPAKLTSSHQSAHFYVLLEVLEEEQQLNIHSFLRHDEFSKNLEKLDLDPSSDSYELPLSLFDPELNNLLLYTRFLSPTAIKLPVPTSNNTVVKAIAASAQTALINLGKWCNGAIEEGWQSTESIWRGNSNNLAWGDVRSTKELNAFSLSRTKLFDSGILVQNKVIALVVTVKEENEENEEKGVLVQIVSHQDECLPPDLKLKVTLNPDTTTPDSQEVIARTADEIIQLEFSEAPGKQFEVEVSYQDTIVHEKFIL